MAEKNSTNATLNLRQVVGQTFDSLRELFEGVEKAGIDRGNGPSKKNIGV
jgi:hypothetical protein